MIMQPDIKGEGALYRQGQACLSLSSGCGLVFSMS